MIKWIDTAAYQLNLPPGSIIHPVIAFSFSFFLKRCISRDQVVSQTLTITESDENLQIDPQFILVRRLIKRNNLAVTQLLMKWPNPLEEDASWEDYDWYKQKYPQFIPERGRNVTI